MAFNQCQIRSNVLDMNTSIAVIYPEHIDLNKEVAVLYLLHGYSGNHMDWVRRTAIERYVDTYQICVVMPEIYNSFYSNNAFGIKYFDYVAQELPLIIEKMYRVSSKKENRYIAGLSMGGYGAMKVGLTYPNQFHKIASFSGVLDIDQMYKDGPKEKRDLLFNLIFEKHPVTNTKDDLFYLVKEAKKKNDSLNLYIACGKDDFLYPHHTKFINYLNQEKIPYEYYETNGGHEWRLWDLFIQKALKWMFD